MSDNSEIEWCDATWNPVRGCDKVSAGCKNCYAETFAERWRGIKGHPFEQGFDMRLVPEALDKPLRWKRPRRIFVNSMSDLFHEGVPLEFIAAVFGVMAACPRHTFQVLTKRPARALEFFRWADDQGHELRSQVHADPPGGSPVPAACAILANMAVSLEIVTGDAWRAAMNAPWPLPNVHLGISAENQETADERIPLLLRCPAAVRWVSAEPLLAPVELRAYFAKRTPIVNFEAFTPEAKAAYPVAPRMMVVGPGIDWVVVGGESGRGARPCDVAWIRSIVEQCKVAGVPVFTKQLGAFPVHRMDDPSGWPPWVGVNSTPLVTDAATYLCPTLADRKGGDPSEWPEDLRVRMFPGEAWA